MSVFKISEQANVIDDNLLNIFGNQFKFDHAKGLAEWIKNSVDAYNRDQRADEDQFIYVRLQPKSPVNPARFECVDFIGMTHDEIEQAFKRWGDPNAASRGKGKKFLGGHGNGGKFYMRQMFDESRFITYRDGKLNVFGFNEHKKYGFDPSYENRPMGLKRALELADLTDLPSNLPKIVRARLEKGQTGFTVVTGEAPHKIQRRNSPKSILQRLCVHPQARRLVQRKQVFAVVAGQPIFQLEAEKIAPRVGFEGPFEFTIPDMVQHGGHDIELANEKYPSAKLKLFTLLSHGVEG